jgi:hypothetical protein
VSEGTEAGEDWSREGDGESSCFSMNHAICSENNEINIVKQLFLSPFLKL